MKKICTSAEQLIGKTPLLHSWHAGRKMRGKTL